MEHDQAALWLGRIEEAAREAGGIMLRARDIRSRVADKAGHANFVTAYDKQVQDMLFDRLRKVVPDAAFIGEENGADRVGDDSRSGYAFCVDPIDGTSNFMTGYRPSMTSIALMKDGEPFIAAVYNPYIDAMFTAIRGRGACESGRPILSSPEPLSRSLVSFGTAPYNSEFTSMTFDMCRYYLPKCIDLRRSGSAAWDLAMMARGDTGLFYECRLGLWDYAAAGLIAMEAGCVLTDLRGKALTWRGYSSVMCASRGVAREDYLYPAP